MDFAGKPSLCFRWRVDARIRDGFVDSPAFGYQGAEWRLRYNCHQGVYLVRMSEGCRPEFNVLVLAVDCSERRILSELTDARRIEARDAWTQIWHKSDAEVRRCDHSFAQLRELRFRLVMIADDSVPLTAYPDVSQSDTSNNTQCTTSVQTPLHASDISCLEDLSDDLSKLMPDQDSGPDVEFQCAGHSTRAHGLIVSARSPVIASMLTTDMVEGRTKVVKIPDIEPDVFRKFLKYLYSGKVEELTYESALGLYEVGDQYSVQGLAKRCSVFLKEHLTVQNACEVLAVADAHSDPEMVEAVVTYILENEVPLEGDSWSTFSDAHPKLANKVLYRFYKSRK